MLRLLSAWLIAASALLFAQAPDGYRTNTGEACGVGFYYPVDYAEFPLPPTETVTRARYVRREVPEILKKAKAMVKPSFDVFVVPKPVGGTTGAAKTPIAESAPASRPEDAAASRPESRPDSRASDSRPEGDSAKSGPKTVREAMLEAGRIVGFDEFRKRRLGGWKLKPLSAPNAPLKEWMLERDDARADAAWNRIGYLALRDDGPQIVGMVATSASPMEREFVVEMRRVARSLAIRADAEALEERLESMYAGKKLRNIPFRIEVRRRLAKGWKAIDTENFIVVHHLERDILVNKIARDLEAVRPVFVETFPPVKPVDAVSIVRVCRNQAEYTQYGGPPNTGGYWHPGNEELVFYDYYQTALDSEKGTARRSTDKDALLVLYHEALHQYIYYAVGQVSPHDWFNEGCGDYFSGAIIPQYGDRVKDIGPSRWRISRIKDLHEGKAPGFIGVERLLNAKRPEYYGPEVGNFYASGWAFVWFLKESPEAKKNPQWSGLLDRYYVTLRDEYTKSVALLGPEATLEEKQKVAETAKDLALKVAIKDVRLDQLEAAWRDYIVKMKHPWPEDRKEPAKGPKKKP